MYFLIQKISRSGLRLAVAAILALPSLPAFADETAAPASDKPESQNPAPPTFPKRSTKHNFRHEIEYPTRKMKQPLLEAWENGWQGALIGLGAGFAVSLIDYGFGGEPEYTGRLAAGLTGVGFLTGSVYGFISARIDNYEIEERERTMLNRFGSVPDRPMLAPITSFANNRAGLGLQLTLPL